MRLTWLYTCNMTVLQMNVWMIIHLNCRERYEDINWSLQLYTQIKHLKFKSEKSWGLNGIWTHDLCETSAVFYQLKYQTNWDLVTLWHITHWWTWQKKSGISLIWPSQKLIYKITLFASKMFPQIDFVKTRSKAKINFCVNAKIPCSFLRQGALTTMRLILRQC